MNETEAGRILAVAIHLDPKFPQPDDAGLLRRIWARTLHDVPFDVAERAVTNYYRSDEYAQHRESLSPANIVQYWNARRRPTEAERTGLNAVTRRALPAPAFDPVSLQAGVDQARAQLLGKDAVRRGEDPALAKDIGEGEAAVLREIRSRPCSFCKAEVGRPCVDGRGNPLTKSPAHPARLENVEVKPRGSVGEALAQIAVVEPAAEAVP